MDVASARRPRAEQRRQFWGIQAGVPHLGGDAAVDALRAFRAGVPWESVLNSWNLLDSHDTARFRTIAGTPERHLVGVGLQMTLPGVPMVFAGDELGQEGQWGEDARRTMPWGEPRDEGFLDAFRELVALRRTRPALARGGIRWVHVDADTIAFVRETHDERLLCVASAHADRECPGRSPSSSRLRPPQFQIWKARSRSGGSMADVAFDEVDKVYENGVQAVFDLTLGINDGEFLVLVGPSGCGKTTALRMVAGLEDISAGTLSIGGRVVNDVTPKERDIAMVFQNYALYPHLSVAENIAFGLRLRKTDKSVINERVTWAAKMLDLTPYLDRRPKELSGGQRQRVAMGRAIVRQPQVFLMDEPLSNLDAKLRVQMRADIAKLQRELGVTTIYVTHDQVEAMTMGDRVAVMSKGRLQQVDAPQRLYDRPENLFVAGFIGTPPMNLIEATASRQRRRDVDLGGQQTARSPTRRSRTYPRLREYGGRKVIVGLRAGDLHPGQEPRDLPKIHARVELVESLGGESMAYSASTPADQERKRGRGGGDLEPTDEASVVGSRPNLVASFPPHVQLKLGDDVAVAVDTKNLHFFDEGSGAPLR